MSAQRFKLGDVVCPAWPCGRIDRHDLGDVIEVCGVEIQRGDRVARSERVVVRWRDEDQHVNEFTRRGRSAEGYEWRLARVNQAGGPT